MLYRLTFDFTIDGHLRVTGIAEGRAVVSAIHLNDKAFAAAVKTADMAPFQAATVIGSRERGKESTGH
jgi:hypothetical protein